MIKLENTITPSSDQWRAIIRGMRNPKNSWDRSDTEYLYNPWGDHEQKADIGPNDHKLMTQLASGGPVHAKYRRMITIYVDITAPFYWWKEFDTYKVGTVANSCSTMHKIADKEFTLNDFSYEHLLSPYTENNEKSVPFINVLENDDIMYSPKGILIAWIIPMLNKCRDLYLKTNDKRYWWQMIQLLPTSYNQKRTVMLNYEVLHNIYIWRKDHKLDEWHTFCDWIKELPYSELITGEEEENK